MKTISTLTLLMITLAMAAGCQPQIVESDGTVLYTDSRVNDWKTPYGMGRRIQTANYSVFTTSGGSLARDTIPAFLEACRRNYLDLTGLEAKSLPTSMPVYVLASRNQWLSLTRTIVGERAMGRFMAIQNGGYCYRDVCVYWVMHGMSTLLVAAHEGMHQFLYHYLEDQLPVWMEEGLCTLAEGYQVGEKHVYFAHDMNVARFADLQSAIARNFWLSMDELLPMNSGGPDGPYTETRTAFYGQLWALAHFLRHDDRYSEGFRRMLADAAQGRLNEALGVDKATMNRMRRSGHIYNRSVSVPLFKYYINSDLETFEKEFREYATRLAQMM